MSYIYLPETESRPYIGCNLDEDTGEFILSVSNHPVSLIMGLPMSVAVKLATEIMEQANRYTKEAA